METLVADEQFGFRKIGSWYLDQAGEARFDLPAELSSTPGLILICSSGPLLIASTRHFGPRVGDFVHALRGDTLNARIHRRITDLLRAGVEVTLWVMEGEVAKGSKSDAIAALDPIWNKRGRRSMSQ